MENYKCSKVKIFMIFIAVVIFVVFIIGVIYVRYNNFINIIHSFSGIVINYNKKYNNKRKY